MAKWRGVFPAVTTKFKENEDLDPAAMEKHFDYQISSGVHGLVTCGSLGEASTLSFDEKLEVTKIALNVANKRVPVLVNVSETRTTNAIRFVEQAANMGVQGFMVMPSVLYAADAREAKDNLRVIAKAAQLPIMVYNNPVTY
ncbi:MAG: dihydrodipicolinate synthase family protein, partial [Undibacterium sp.]|nr:dihydrodipicolinate synthase family protein [Undibacterium sp.]